MGILYRKFSAVLIASLAVPIAAVVLFCTINVKPTLLPLENEVLGFQAPPPLSVDSKNLVLSDLRNPLGGQAMGYPPIALTEVAPLQGSPGESIVSLIVMGKTTRIAVVQGTVLKEGDAFQGTTVARIQKDGVLLKNGKEGKWLMVR